MVTTFSQSIPGLLYLTFVIAICATPATSDATDTGKTQYNSPSSSGDCPYPCLPPPTAYTPPASPNCPPPPPANPSPPSGPGFSYPPPGSGGYYYSPPPPPGYNPNLPPTSINIGPPPPDPILPYFPFYYKKPPPPPPSSSSTIGAVGNKPTFTILHFVLLVLFLH